MNREKDLKKYNIRTDLLVESIKDNNNIKPVINIEDKIKITTVKVDEKTEKLINKKQGNYITIEFEDVTDFTNKEKVKEIFS